MNLYEIKSTGKSFTIEQQKARNKADVEAMVKKITALIKKRVHYGEILFGEYNGNWWINVENGEGDFAHDMYLIINKNPRVKIISVEETPGRFDWAADTYIKDRSEVEFKFV